MAKKAELFQTNYEILERNAERLQHDDSVTVDDLVPIVEESLKAKKVCEERLEQVQNALAQLLDQSDDAEE